MANPVTPAEHVRPMRTVFASREAKGLVMKHFKADMGAVQHLERIAEVVQTLEAAGGAS